MHEDQFTSPYAVYAFSSKIIVIFYDQDDEGDNAFHIAADTAKMVRENLQWIVVMLQYPDAAIDVRNHR